MDTPSANHVRMLCPHCEQEIRVGLRLEAVGKTQKGPKAVSLGQEVDSFVISAIDDFHLSFPATAKLLEEQKILTARGGKRWYPSGVSRYYYAALNRRAEQK